MTRIFTATLSMVCLALLYACATPTDPSTQQTAAHAAATPSQQAQALFETIFNEHLDRSPVYQSFLGLKTNYDKWDDGSEAFAEQTHELNKDQLKRLLAINVDQLDPATALSYAMMKQQLANDIADYRWRYHDYPVSQMYGLHTFVPSFLINQHTIADEAQAEDYISRLQGVTVLFDQGITGLKTRADKGIIIPRFVFPQVLEASKNILTGAPFTDGDDSVLLADFKGKVNALDLPDATKKKLIEKAAGALVTHTGPAYKQLISFLKDLETRADTNDGAWKFPDGEAFYNNALARTTTTDLSASEIHSIGLSEVARIHAEMRDIMIKVGFKGDLNDFFEFMRTDKQFYYDNTEEGKAAYLAKATDIIDNMKARLDELFIIKPKADLLVKRVEAFREKSSGKAFYQMPALDGSRPGLYYANLYDMADMPTYQMEALAYHEGIPGHHMQIAIAQELKDVPKFRKFGHYTAYIEGWGLYSEKIPKEMGLYEDPYSDFGRLAMELWRACRLVVDTGIHAKKWTREQAIDYLVKNTPNPKNDAVKAIERYIVMPSQATAYKIGMLKILQLRQEARDELGERFDIREFHDVVLKNGAVPLDILENLVNEWIEQKSQS